MRTIGIAHKWGAHNSGFYCSVKTLVQKYMLLHHEVIYSHGDLASKLNILQHGYPFTFSSPFLYYLYIFYLQTLLHTRRLLSYLLLYFLLIFYLSWLTLLEIFNPHTCGFKILGCSKQNECFRIQICYNIYLQMMCCF